MKPSRRLKILLRDRDWIALHKPSGMPVYSDTGPGFLDFAQDQLNQKLFPVHRLDKGTCGIVVFAYSSKSAAQLQKLFLGRSTRKTYWAVGVGTLTESEGLIREPLPDSKSKQKKSALTAWKVLESREITLVDDPPDLRTAHFLELHPETGRYHQIRKHLRFLGVPIVGDPDYGNRFVDRHLSDRLGIQRILLSSVGMTFPHPTQAGRWIKLRTQPDPDFLDALKALRFKKAS